MNQASLLYIPDAGAMLFLMGVLLSLRRDSERRDVVPWMMGLSFILLEALASDAYRSTLIFLRTGSHMVALGSFVLAGFTFAWVGRRDSFPRMPFGSLCLTAALPLLAITLIYGANVHSAQFFVAAIIASMVAQAVCMALVLRRPGTILIVAALELGGWGPMLWFAWVGEFRSLTYWALGYLFLLVAASLWSMVERSKVGGGVVVAAFVVWACCLLSHPYTHPGSVLNSLVDQVWTLQKFFVTIGLLLVVLDEERQHNRELALYDALTGLPNRRLFDDRLSQAIARTNRSALPFALFVIDLDDFKSINDELGHAQGDAVLREAARRLAAVVRSSDTLARFGGDEFAVIVNEVSGDEPCERIAAQMRTALNLTPLVPPAGTRLMRPVMLQGSVGFALYPTDTHDAATLQRIADRRMYEQKALERTSVPAGS